ncbi:UNVERIFIED_CONTAM: hypothetical protein PYX00_009384 [Menopon gallinae]|uniref:Serine/threonine-protein phosphatase PGAM5, mitochondrial n=1 Tax=Menopon gallinae TaxID=328185 RepID=A0AAW2HBE7_9NEOP
MASYFKRFSVYILPGAAISVGLSHFNQGWSEDGFVVYAARPVRSAPGNTANGGHSYKWDPNWDRRNPPEMLEERGIRDDDKNYSIELEKCKPRASRNLLLIRHGQYNIKGNNDEERMLTALGREQAEITGNRLKELNLPYASLHKSTMTRAQETAEIILNCLKDITIPEIKNCNLLEEGAPIPPDPPIKHWRPEVHFFRDGARIEAAFRKYFYRADVSQNDDSYEIIVCHANVIRYFVCRALQLPPDAWLRFSLNHCSITWFTITPSGRVLVRCVGDTGHMPVNLVTNM